jgi:hypothetical protein
MPTGHGAEANSGLFRVGINGNDEQVIDPSSAATFLIILPDEVTADTPPHS